MQTLNDVHQQFAEYFGLDALKPYLYLLSKKMEEGHVCLPLRQLTTDDQQLLPEAYQHNIAPIKTLKKQPLIQYNDQHKEPFVIYNDSLYLQRYFNYESILLNRIKQFIKEGEQVFKQRVALIKNNERFIKQLFSSPLPLHKTNWQLAAAVSAILNNFTIITGGPGTGKTTTVAKILGILLNENINLKIALAAPTGKAAMRMAEALKQNKINAPEIEAKFAELKPATIHRLLKAKFNSLHFKHNKLNPINADVIIVDESSMIDVALLAKLMDAIAPNTRLILIGDKDQLASVEAGSLFGDLCQAQKQINQFSPERADLINSLTQHPLQNIEPNNISSTHSHSLFEHVIELKHSHRFSSDKGIGKFSKAIISNNIKNIETFFTKGKDDQVTIDEYYDEALFNSFVMGYAAYINEPDTKEAFKKLNEFRVLCAIREGNMGLHALNKKIEEQLIKNNLIKRTGEFYENRPIMVSSNNYELGLFNGDIGIIRSNENGVMMAWFEDNDGNLKQVLPGFIANAETVFAMTIHKSQGSEFNNVFIVLPDTETLQMLTRELLYTGITRAKNKVTLQATKQAIVKTASLQVQRASGLAERLNK